MDNLYGIYGRSDGAWHFEGSFETAADAARFLSTLTDGIGVFSPPVADWIDDLSDGYSVQATDRLGTRFALVAMPFPATVSVGSTMATRFANLRPEMSA